MQLEKFYLDVVGPDGDGCVAYAVRLPALGLTLAGVLHWPADPAAPVAQRRSLRGSVPVVGGDTVNWICPGVAASGTWCKTGRRIEETLWSEANESVHWQVLASSAHVHLEIGATEFRGFGYAEKLTLDVAPWRLPIDGLRWGRFTSPSDSVVWIKWEHVSPRQWVWHNGRAVAATEIGESRVAWPGHRLALGRPRTLRTGRLGETVFARWSRVRRLLPHRIQAYEETKWCAPAILTAPLAPAVSGWAIHEFVRLR